MYAKTSAENKCVICNHIYESNSESERIHHFRAEHHGQGICIYCNLKIHYDMMKHVLLRHVDRCPYCECSDQYISYSDSMEHLKTFHKGKMLSEQNKYV